MAITDRERLKALEASQLSSNEGDMTGTAKTIVSKAHYRYYTAQLTDAATAGTNATETVVCYLTNKSRLIAAYIAAPAAVAADNTDYGTITVAKRTAGGSATTIASGDSRAASLNGLTAFSPAALTNTATTANLDIAAGDAITVKLIKSGSGKAFSTATAPASVTVVVEEI